MRWTPAKPSYLKVTPSGQFLLASYFTSGQVTVHQIVGEGRISDRPLHTPDIDPHAHCITCDPGGRFVFVAHTSVGRISQFRFDDKAGILTPNDPPAVQRDDGVWPATFGFTRKTSLHSAAMSVGAALAFTGSIISQSVVRGFGISPDGRFLVAAGQQSNKLDCFRIGKDGSLKRTQSVETGKTPWWVSFPK